MTVVVCRVMLKGGLFVKLTNSLLSQEPMSRSLQLPYEAYVTAFLQTDLFLVYLFFCERKAVPVQ